MHRNPDLRLTPGSISANFCGLSVQHCPSHEHRIPKDRAPLFLKASYDSAPT